MDPDSNKIKELRKKEHIQRKELAARMSITESALGKIECGKTNLSVRHVEQIARATGKTATAVFGYLIGETDSLSLGERSGEEAKLDREVNRLQGEIESLRKDLAAARETIERQDAYIRTLTQMLDFLKNRN